MYHERQMYINLRWSQYAATVQAAQLQVADWMSYHYAFLFILFFFLQTHFVHKKIRKTKYCVTVKMCWCHIFAISPTFSLNTDQYYIKKLKTD